MCVCPVTAYQPVRGVSLLLAYEDWVALQQAHDLD